MSKNIPTKPIQKCLACMTSAGAGKACLNDLLTTGSMSNDCMIAAFESYNWVANTKLCSDSCKILTPADMKKLMMYRQLLDTNLALPGFILNKFNSAKEKEPSKYESAYEDAKQCILDMSNGGATISKACRSVITYCKTLGCAEDLDNLAANWNYPFD